MTKRLRLVLGPHRRQVVVYPSERGPAQGPGVNFAKREPEVLAAERRAIAEQRPKGLRLDFNCRHSGRQCEGCFSTEDARLADFLIRTGMCMELAPADAWSEQVRRATAAEDARAR
jgi:hypothetical protein